jgi:hypothetical protein
MVAWYWIPIAAFIVLFVMEWHMGKKCKDCEKIARIWRAGK